MTFQAVTLLFLLQINSLVFGQDFMRTNQRCNLYYISPRTAIKGLTYNSTEASLCCDENTGNSVPGDAIQSRISGCCQQAGNTCYTNGVRPCPKYTCIASFASLATANESPNGQAPNIMSDNSFNRKICSDVNTLEPTGMLAPNQIIPLLSKKNCVDPGMQFHILFLKMINGTIRKLHDSCCDGDITSDYELNPREVCCGLSGSPSPYYGYLNGSSSEYPRCCNSNDYRNTCDPANLARFTGGSDPFQKCQPQAGLYNMTTLLSRNLPLYSPRYYYKQRTQPDRLSTCTNPTNSSFKYLYSIQDLQDGYFENVQHSFGLCCKKQNAFAEDPRNLINSCCITYLDNVSNTGNRVNLQCTTGKPSILQYTFSSQYIFPSCITGACKNGILSSNQQYRVSYKISPPIDNLYGVYKFFSDQCLLAGVLAMLQPTLDGLTATVGTLTATVDTLTGTVNSLVESLPVF